MQTLVNSAFKVLEFLGSLHDVNFNFYPLFSVEECLLADPTPMPQRRQPTVCTCKRFTPSMFQVDANINKARLV